MESNPNDEMWRNALLGEVRGPNLMRRINTTAGSPPVPSRARFSSVQLPPERPSSTLRTWKREP
jgi:hypothetical protein